MSAASTSYDDVPYLSTAIAECDPLQMALVAGLHGVPAADPATADVLDIGCGDAGNLISLATAHPGLRATGVDPSVEAIRRATEIRDGAGLTNVTLQLDESEARLDASADYVIVHGVLSWVPDGPRAEVLELAARAARPGGLVMFSYRAYPQAHYLMVSRQMALAAIADAEAEAGRPLSHHEHARIARERVRLAARTVGPKSVHGQMLAAEADKLDAYDPWVIFHDDLSDPLQPFRMTEVVRLARAQGLTYVGEVLPADRWQARLPQKVADEVRQLAGPDAVRRQQLVDDLTNNGFHSSLFVRGDATPRLEPDPGDLPLYVRSFVHGTVDGDRRSDAISPPVAQVIREHGSGTVTTRAIAQELGRDEADVVAAALALHANGLARLSLSPPPVPAPPGERPLTSPLVAHQLRTGQSFVTSRFHVSISYEAPVYRVLLLLLDGTRDRAALRAELPAAAEVAGVTEGVPQMLTLLDDVLAQLADDGVLMPPAEG